MAGARNRKRAPDKPQYERDDGRARRSFWLNLAFAVVTFLLAIWLLKPLKPSPPIQDVVKIGEEPDATSFLGGLIEKRIGDKDPTEPGGTFFQANYEHGKANPEFFAQIITLPHAKPTLLRVLFTNVDGHRCIERFLPKNDVLYVSNVPSISLSDTRPIPNASMEPLGEQKVNYFGFQKRQLYRFDFTAEPFSEYRISCPLTAEPEELTETRRRFTYVAPGQGRYDNTFGALNTESFAYFIPNSADLVVSGASKIREHFVEFLNANDAYTPVGVEIEWTDVVAVHDAARPQLIGGIFLGLAITFFYELVRAIFRLNS